MPFPPVPRPPGGGDSEERRPGTPPGIGHNRPPKEGGKPESGVRDVPIRDDVTDITRKGGLKESLDEYNKAVRTAGGDPKTVKPVDRNGETTRPYKAPDGTRFIHRTISTEGNPTVEIQIERQLPSGKSTGKVQDVIEVRFESED